MKIAYTNENKGTTTYDSSNIIFNIKEKNIYAKGVKFLGTDTTYDIVNSSTDGLVPAFGTSSSGGVSQASWILSKNTNSVGWYLLPTTAFSDTLYSLSGSLLNDYTFKITLNENESVLNNVIIPKFTKTSAGLVPLEDIEDDKYLRGNGTWDYVYKIALYITTSNQEYPILLSNHANADDIKSDYVYFTNTIKINPSTSCITASKFKGTADKALEAITQELSDNSTNIATTAFVKTAINNLIDGASGAYDTLKEIEAFLKNSDTELDALLEALDGKVSKAGDTMTGLLTNNVGINTKTLVVTEDTLTKKLTITDTTSNPHLEFTRSGNNYITAPSGGTINILPNGIPYGQEVGMLFSEHGLHPRSTNSSYTLGTSSKRWNSVFANTIYGNVQGNLIGGSSELLVYLTNTDTTGFLEKGTNNQVLCVLNNKLTWSNLDKLGVIEHKSTMTVTTAWSDVVGLDNFNSNTWESGVYLIYLYIHNGRLFYYHVYSGLMSVYKGTVNANQGLESEEIFLHGTFHAAGNRIYLRTHSSQNLNIGATLLISAVKEVLNLPLQFKFKKLL